MSISTIFSGVVAIATLLPKIKSWVDEFMGMWVDKKVNDIRQNYNLKENKMAVLNKMLKEAKTDEEIVVLSIVLHDLKQGEK